MTENRIHLSKTADKVVALAEPLIESLGYGCVHVEFRSGSAKKGGLLCVYIDREGGISVTDCAQVSRQLDVVLEVEDVVGGAYTLEVSSPGVDRTLGRRVDFEFHAGEQVRIRTVHPIEERRNWSGELAGVKDDCVLITLDTGVTAELPLGEIQRANIKHSFEQRRA